MKKNFITTLLLATALTATAQDIPLRLLQRLEVAPTVVLASGNHHVRVVCDTGNYIIVNTMSSMAEAQNKSTLGLSSDGRTLTIPSEYPYWNIDVHTTAESLSLTANDNTAIRLEKHIGATVRLSTLKLTATGPGSRMETLATIEADDAVLTASNGAKIYCIELHAKHLEKNSSGGIISLMNGGILNEESTSVYSPSKENGGVVRLMLNHDLPVFASLSVGATGWSGSLFGGMTGEMGTAWHRFRMGVNPTGYVALQYGVNLLTRRHWSLGVGLGITEEHFAAENARIDIVGNNLLNADLSPYYSSTQFLQHYQPGDIVWRSSMDINYLYLPLRAEWRLKSSYRGLRISAQLMPGVALWRSKTTLVRQGNYPDRLGSATRDRIDVETTNVGRYVNPLRCDLRLDVGISNFSLFVQTALTPLFRHQSYFLAVILPADQYDAINEAVYPMSIGCSINL